MESLTLRRTIISISLFVSVFISPASLFPGPAATPISKITIEVQGRTPVEEIRKILPFKEGDPYESEKVDQALSYLKKWGRFAEALVAKKQERQGWALLFQLREGFIISGIDIEHTYPFLSTRIRRVINIHSGDLYDIDQAQSQTEKIVFFYQRQGFEGTKVSLKPKFNFKKNTVDLTYKVRKGSRYRIKDISVSHNTVFPHGYFVSQINPLLAYTPERLRKSLAKIRKGYQNKGYLAARIRLLDLGKKDADKTVNPSLEVKEGRKVTVLFQGNARVSRRTFKKILPLFIDGGYGPREMELSVKEIERHYRKLGFQEISVESREEKKKDDSLVITFLIHEGPQTRVKSIRISGNKIVSDKKIKKDLLTQEQSLFEPGIYQPHLIEEDEKRLPQILKNQGALGSRLLNQETEFNRFRDKAKIKFDVEESPITYISKVTFEGNEAFSSNRLRRILKIKERDPLQFKKLEADKEALLAFYSNHGFPHIAIKDQWRIAPSGDAELTYLVSEGVETRIGEILTVGNERTLDKSIRRNIRINPGERFSHKKILESESSLRRSGAFRSVSIQTIGLAEQEPVVHLIVKLEEHRKITLDVGGGYDTDDFFTGNLTLSNANLFGTIRRANLKLIGGRDIQRGEVLFKEPFFFGYPLEASTNFFVERDLKPGFKTVEGGGSLNFLKEFTPRLTFLGRYEIIRTFFTDVIDPTGTTEEDHTTSKFGFSTNYDKRDSYADPQKGFVAFAGIDVSNKIVASRFNFIQPKGYLAHYKKLGMRMTLVNFFRMEGIKVFGSDSLTRDERLFLGGDYSLRGFDEDAVGPVGSDDRPAGGQLLLLLSTELQTKLFNNFKFALFLDNGSLTQGFTSDATTGDPGVSLESLRHGAGFGFRYMTPVGALRLDYGFKLDKRVDEDLSRLHFAFGYAF